MTDPEQLVQRFIDQELTAEERVQFVVRLGRDAALRERVVELEQLALGVGRLPKPIVPDDFVASVMAKTEQRPSLWRRLTDPLTLPRDIRWNLAGAVAALALVAVSLVVVGGLGFATGRSMPSSAAPAAASAAAPPTVLVRLIVLQPGARTVEVAGDFNEWNPARSPLEHVTGGAWSVTLPLKPGRYEYQFVVDGQTWIVDPLATEVSDDGFGSRNGVLDVRGVGESM